MFIKPSYAIEQGWITAPNCNILEDWERKKLVSPNAIDFTVDTIHNMVRAPSKEVWIGEGKKVMREVSLYEPEEINQYNGWYLETGRCYDAMSDIYVKVPEGVAALLYTRSTFVRNGTFIMSGLYDSGFTGHIGYVIFNMGGQMFVEQGTRIGQIAFVHSENAGLYAGGYNHAAGTHYTEINDGD